MSLLTATETLEAARTARARGDVDACIRAAALAIDKAKDERAWDVAFLAACAPGRLYATRAEPECASGWYRRALELALDHGNTRRLPEVYHDLFLTSRDGADSEQARRYFATSTELYLNSFAKHPRIAALHADAAEAKFMRKPSRETAADALLYWQSFCAAISDPTDRLLGGCSVMAAAAWLGYPKAYSDGVAMMEEAYPRLPDMLGVASALLHGAGGALRVRDYPRAVNMAQDASRIAVGRGEGIVAAQAREVLSAALAERQRPAYT